MSNFKSIPGGICAPQGFMQRVCIAASATTTLKRIWHSSRHRLRGRGLLYHQQGLRRTHHS